MILKIVKWIVVLVAVAGVGWMVSSSGVLSDPTDETGQTETTGDASVSGDVEGVAGSTSTTGTPASSSTTSSTTTSTSTTTTTIPDDDLSAGKGPMHVVIAASESSRAGAEGKVAELERAVGTPTGFTVDESGHYEGLVAGFWVVIHGAKDKTAAEAVRARTTMGSFHPYIRTVTKSCDDSIAIES